MRMKEEEVFFIQTFVFAFVCFPSPPRPLTTPPHPPDSPEQFNLRHSKPKRHVVCSEIRPLLPTVQLSIRRDSARVVHS